MTSRQVSAMMISVCKGWSAVLTPLPMTRRYDAVGADNWSAEGGAAMNARGGKGGGGLARPACCGRRPSPDRDCAAST